MEVRKYAPDTHALSELAPRSLVMIVRLAASVVWSMRARRSTLAQARNIYNDCEWRNVDLLSDAHCDDSLD